MPKGLPKKYIKKWGITKKAWREYHAAQARKAKHIGCSKSRTRKSKTTRRKNPKRRVRRTGRRRKRRGGKSIARTVMKWLRIGALVAPAAAAAIDPKWPRPKDKLHVIIYRYTGYDMSTGRWNPAALSQGWGPYIVTCLLTYGIPKLSGIIRKL